MSQQLSFYGEAGTVTGSRFLVEAKGSRFLVNAGMFQGLKNLRAMNWKRSRFEPYALDFVLFTHAHIDHSGYLPRLTQNGLRCPVYCIAATLDLAKLLLMDTAKMQEEDAAYANRKGFSKHKPALTLYTAADAQRAIELLTPVEYGEWISPGQGVRALLERGAHPRCGDGRSAFAGPRTRAQGRLQRRPWPLRRSSAIRSRSAARM